MIIRDCLGREREPDKIWPDGSYNCPFCWAAVRSTDSGCPNPACTARPGYPIERAREELARQEQRAKETREREELDEWRRKYAEERHQERLAVLANIQSEAIRRGACIDCALKNAPYRTKYVKHRTTCPLKRARA